MKMRSFLMLAAGMLLLAGCSKDNEKGTQTGGNEDGTFDMYIQFNIGSKADAGKVNSGYVTEFTTGAIFFVDGNDDIVRMAIIDDSPAGAVTPTRIQDGYLFTDIDNSAQKVYVIGNHQFVTYDATGLPTVATFANLAEVEAITKEILSQTNQNNRTTFGVEDATLYGSGNIVPASPSTIAKFTSYPNITVEREAIFNITPIIARLEINEITASGVIDGLDLAGIYINNFYVEMSVIGTVNLADLFHPGDQATDFDKYLRTTTSQSNGEYDPKWYEYLYDDGDVDASGDYQGIGSGALAYTPANGAWAYNVFANGSAVPHIVLHFTNVTIDETANGGSANTPRPNISLGSGHDGEAYLTITGYTTGTGGTVRDEPIIGGNVYELRNIVFDEGDLDDYPYEESDKSALYVEVTVTPWNVIPVDWKK